MRLFITTSLLFISIISYSQVGIGTVSPQETLHINGTARVDSLQSNNQNSVLLTGIDTNNTLQEITVGDNLLLQEGVLSATTSNIYDLAVIDDEYIGNTFNNLDLDLTGVNADVTVFILNEIGPDIGGFRITGIQGGTDGRLIVLKLLQVNANMNLISEFTPGGELSAPENRIRILNTTSVSNFGSFTLVYSGLLQRWIMINQQND